MDKILIISKYPQSIDYIYERINGLFSNSEFISILFSQQPNLTLVKNSYFIKTSYPLNLNLDKIIHKIKDISPRFIFSSSDIHSKSFSAVIAAKMECGVLSDIDEISVKSNNIVFEKPYLKGTRAILSSKTVPTIITIPCPFSYTSQNNRQKYHPTEIEVEDTFEVKLEKATSDSNSLEYAKKIVCIGRGVKKEDIPKIHDFAKSIGAVVGYTRPVREELGIDQSLQIGITGKTISPELYITFGVSGKDYHIKGVINPKIVISINIDPNAPIKNFSDYFILCDYQSFIGKIKNI